MNKSKIYNAALNTANLQAIGAMVISVSFTQDHGNILAAFMFLIAAIIGTNNKLNAHKKPKNSEGFQAFIHNPGLTAFILMLASTVNAIEHALQYAQTQDTLALALTLGWTFGAIGDASLMYLDNTNWAKSTPKQISSMAGRLFEVIKRNPTFIYAFVAVPFSYVFYIQLGQPIWGFWLLMLEVGISIASIAFGIHHSYQGYYGRKTKGLALNACSFFSCLTQMVFAYLAGNILYTFAFMFMILSVITSYLERNRSYAHRPIEMTPE